MTLKKILNPPRKLYHALLFSIWLCTSVATGNAADNNTALQDGIDGLIITRSARGVSGTPAASAKSVTAKVSREHIQLNSDGTLRTLRAPNGQHYPVKGAVPGNPEATAEIFIKQNAKLLGADNPKVGFTPYKKRTAKGRTTVKHQQSYSGIPFFASEIIVQINDDGGIDYLASSISRDLRKLDDGTLSLTPVITSSAAAVIAREHLLKKNPVEVFTTDNPRLIIFDPKVLGSNGQLRLAWQLTVACPKEPALDAELIIDAQSGELLRAYPVNKPALNRTIYDGNNTTAWPGTLARSEGGAASGVAEVNNGYNFLGQTYNYYSNHFSRDSLDNPTFLGIPTGGGIAVAATVRRCKSAASCPMGNAFGGSAHMQFGDGWATDDVVGHEYTHGVTAYESNLVYENASGAINEALSDIFGEFVDWNNNPAGTDAQRWLFGEDLPNGSLRDMKNPPVFSQPDRLGNSLYVQPVDAPSDANDQGGVHTNSGIINKLAYLLTDGDSFNGYSVYGVGEWMVAALFYEANVNTLTSSSGYYDLSHALIQAANNLGWSQNDKNNLHSSCLAVEIFQGSTVYVDSNSGTIFEFGSTLFPYKTVSGGVSNAWTGDSILIKSGSYPGAIVIDKALTLENWTPGNGEVVIGP